MKRVTGIGGIFIKSADTKRLREWYQKHLGIDVQEWGGTSFDWAGPHNPDLAGAKDEERCLSLRLFHEYFIAAHRPNAAEGSHTFHLGVRQRRKDMVAWRTHGDRLSSGVGHCNELSWIVLRLSCPVQVLGMWVVAAPLVTTDLE